MHLWIFIEMCVYAMHPEVHRGSPLFTFRQTWAAETNLISHLWEQIIQRNLNNNIRKPENIWFGLYFNLYHFPFTCTVLMKTRDNEESKFNYKTIIWQITNMLMAVHEVSHSPSCRQYTICTKAVTDAVCLSIILFTLSTDINIS